jgi:hypothetical protein
MTPTTKKSVKLERKQGTTKIRFIYHNFSEQKNSAAPIDCRHLRYRGSDVITDEASKGCRVCFYFRLRFYFKFRRYLAQSNSANGKLTARERSPLATE